MVSDHDETNLPNGRNFSNIGSGDSWFMVMDSPGQSTYLETPLKIVSICVNWIMGLGYALDFYLTTLAYDWRSYWGNGYVYPQIILSSM